MKGTEIGGIAKPVLPTSDIQRSEGFSLNLIHIWLPLSSSYITIIIGLDDNYDPELVILTDQILPHSEGLVGFDKY